MPYDELGNYIPESLALDEMLYELAKKGSMPVRPGGSDVPYVASEIPEHYVAKPSKPPVTTATNVPQAIADRLGISAIPQAALQIATAFPAEVAKGMGYPESSKSIAEFGRPTSKYANAINEALSVAPQVITGSHMGLGPMPETWISGLGSISPDDIRVLAKQNIERGRELRAIPEDFANAKSGFQRESALGGNTYGGNLQRAAEDVGDVMARNQARRSEYSAPMTGSVEVFGNLMPDNAMYAVRPSKTGNQVLREVPTELNPAYKVTDTSSLTEDLANLVNTYEPVTQDDKTYRRTRQYTNMVPENFNKSAQDMYHEYIMPALAKEFPNIEPDQYAQALSMRYGQKNANDWYKKQLEAFALTPEAAEHNKAAYQMAMADPEIPDPFEFLKEVLIVPPSAQFKGEQAADQWIMKNLQDYLVEHLGTPTDPLLTLTKETGRTGIPQEGMNQLLNNRRTEDEAKLYRKEGNMPVEGTFEREIGQMTNLLGQNNLTIQLLQDKENELVTNNPGVAHSDIPGWREARKEVVQATKRKDETAKKLENLNKAQAIENYNDTLIRPKPEQRFTENMEEYEKERFPMLPTGKDTVYQMRLPTQLRELAKEVRNRLAISGAPGISGLVKAENVSQYSIPKAVQVRAELMAQREKIGEKAAKMAEEKLITHTKKRMETMPKDGVFGPATVGRISKDLGADQIRADLSDITYWLDHCIGRGGSPEKKTLSPMALMLGVQNVSSEGKWRQYVPSVAGHLNNKVQAGSSGAFTTYMNNVKQGISDVIDFRDTNTGIPFATLELKVSNTDPSKYRFGEFYGYQDHAVTGPMVPNRGTEHTPEEIQAYRQSIADWANSQAHKLAPVSNHYLSENAEIYDMESADNRTSLARQLGASVKQAADVSNAMDKRFVTLNEAKELWKTKQEEPQESLESLRAARDELEIQLREAEDPEATMGVTQMDDIRHQITDLDSRIAAIENRPPVGSRAVSPINDPTLPAETRELAHRAYDVMTEYARRAIPGALDTTDMPARITFADDMVNNPQNYGLQNYAPVIRQIVAEEYRMNGLAPTQPAQQELQVRPDWNRQTNQVREDTLNELDEIDRYTLSSAIEETQNRFAFSQQPHEFVAELDRRAAYFEGRNQPELANAIRNVAMGYDSQIVREPVAQVPAVRRVNEPYVAVRTALQHLVDAEDIEGMTGIANNIMENRNGPYGQLDDTQRIRLRQQLYGAIDRIQSEQQIRPIEDVIEQGMNQIRNDLGEQTHNDVDRLLTAINDNYDVMHDAPLFIERIRRHAEQRDQQPAVADALNHMADELTEALRHNTQIVSAQNRAAAQAPEETYDLVLDDDHLDNIASDIVNNFANATPEFIRNEAGDMRNGMYDLPEFREMTETQRDSAQDALANRMEMHADMMEDMEPPTQRTPEQNAIAEATQFPRYWYQRFPNLPQEIVTNIMTRLNADDRDFEGLRVAARNRTRGTIFAGLNHNAREDAVRMLDEIGNRYQNELNVRDGQQLAQGQYNNATEAFNNLIEANGNFMLPTPEEGFNTLRALPQLLERENLRAHFGTANLTFRQRQELIQHVNSLIHQRSENSQLPPPGHKRGGYIQKMKDGGTPKFVNPEDRDGMFTYPPGYYQEAADAVNSEGQSGGYNDAARHIIAAADVSRRINSIPVIGKHVAEPITNAMGKIHEYANYVQNVGGAKPQTVEDMQQDLHNNRVGAKLGLTASSFQDIVNRAPELLKVRPYQNDENKAMVRHPDEQKTKYKPFGAFAKGGIVHMNEGGMAFPEDIQRGLAEGRITQNQAEYIHNARLNPVPAHWGDHMSYQDRYNDALETRPKYVPPTAEEIRNKAFLDKQDPMQQPNVDMNREQLRKNALQTQNPAVFRNNPSRVGGGGGSGRGGPSADMKQIMNPRNIAYKTGGDVSIDAMRYELLRKQ